MADLWPRFVCVCPYGKLQTNASAFHSGRERGVNVSETGQEVNAYNMSRTVFFSRTAKILMVRECVKINFALRSVQMFYGKN